VNERLYSRGPPPPEDSHFPYTGAATAKRHTSRWPKASGADCRWVYRASATGATISAALTRGVNAVSSVHNGRQNSSEDGVSITPDDGHTETPNPAVTPHLVEQWSMPNSCEVPKYTSFVPAFRNLIHQMQKYTLFGLEPTKQHIWCNSSALLHLNPALSTICVLSGVIWHFGLG
jgi:hypothetical protein